ncbi:hypothetical protein [Actinophytocola xanthii]|uniref:PPM-type phosphatase domain-containing protein n=1 Tax=Actinophytocola xanthii TaxID=1912961 RepID=A0A1Q8CN14_9PSEU|nr:hypothetical protein [Actinophytocola xanthii]OLF15734.1 hypothetical protein BU204_20205 [Actinophytocola xanthii]
MKIDIAEQPGVGLDGQPRPSEDVVVPLPNAVVLLDGATSTRPGRGGGWYARVLAGHLVARLTGYPTMDLADLLAAAIHAVAREHDLVPGDSPSSTVALVRWSAETVEGLVLADSPVVAVTGGGTTLLADHRLAALPRRGGGYRGRLRAGAGYGEEHVAALRAAAAQVGELRNTEGGFWVAEADPDAAYQAVRASWPRAATSLVLLASDGVSCGVDDYGLFDWPAVVELVRTRGPQAVLDEVRAAEESDRDGRRWPRPKVHDDQALAVVDLTPDQG